METTTKYEIPQEVKDKLIASLKANKPEIYWHYDDKISVEQMNKVISEKDGYFDFVNELEEQCLDSYYELERQALISAIDDLDQDDQMKLIDPEDLPEDIDDIDWTIYLQDLHEEFQDCICVELNVDQLIRNSREEVFFYSTGIELNGYGYYEEDMRAVKKFLKIPMRDKTWDQEIKEAVVNASYGGTLCFAFSCGLEKWMWDEEDPTTITFKDPYIVIPNHGNGSGWYSQLYRKGDPRFEITLPFKRENMYLDNAVKYSFTHDVCGMSNDWCDDTTVNVGYQPTRKKIARSKISDHMKREAELNATFKAGGCTYGDMDINRHRNTPYRNEFPCGDKCTTCGTFWVD